MGRLRPLTGPVVCIAVLALSLVPALASQGAADETIEARSNNTWSKTDVTIALGESVTWKSAPGTGYHNVRLVETDPPWSRPETGPSNNWPSSGYTYTFNEAGTYTFICEPHEDQGMKGTVTVTRPAGSPTQTPTGTSTATATATVTTTATATATVTPSPDTYSARVLRTRHRTLVLSVKVTSDAPRRIIGTLRRKRRARYRSFGSIAFTARPGAATYRFRRTARGQRLLPGRYVLELRFASDPPSTRTLRFRIS